MTSTKAEPVVTETLENLVSRLAEAPMLKVMNQRLISVSQAEAVVEVVPAHQFENSMKRMHGGFVATLIDTALGVAVMARLPARTGYGTVDLNIKYVRKVDVESGPLLARARVLHAGRTMFTADCQVEDSHGKLCAHGSGTFLVYPT